MRIHKLLLLLLLLAACSPAVPGPTTPPATEVPVATAVDTASPPTPTATPLQLTSGNLVFTLESPADGEIVSEAQVMLKGTTTVETVLSVNDEIYVLPGGQPFSIQVPLTEGPNALGIVASDADGNSIDFVLTVTYQP